MKTFRTLLFMIILGSMTSIVCNGQGVSNPIAEPSIMLELSEAKAIKTNASQELVDYINQNLIFPDKAYEMQITGSASIKVKIDHTGKITSTEIIKSGGLLFDHAILRTLVGLKTLSPVYVGEQASAYSIVVPIQFVR